MCIMADCAEEVVTGHLSLDTFIYLLFLDYVHKEI